MTTLSTLKAIPLVARKAALDPIFHSHGDAWKGEGAPYKKCPQA